ncbi:uncharacterized protein [Asterias amurensis]|uniref:uncharacterized protein n=1 Tax=Asterias amurensis TaxID=7602 RepID=UPI003AB67435
MAENVYFYVPNIIGYGRLLLVLLSWFYWRNPPWLIGFYMTSLFLDAINGTVARKLHQTSAFGVWLDLVVDNVGRGMLWSQIYKWGCFVSALEWCVLVCTHTAGAQWKSNYGQAPWLVKNVMSNDCKTPVGLYTAWSLHLLPLWLYAYRSGFLTAHIPGGVVYFVISVLSVGRAMCAAVELYCIWAHIQQMISSDISQKSLLREEKDQKPDLV